MSDMTLPPEDDTAERSVIPVTNTTIPLRAGVYFSMDTDDRVFTGDLFFDLLQNEFRMNGIPAVAGRMVSATGHHRGPFKLALLILGQPRIVPRPNGTYVDMFFKTAKSSGEFAALIEETHGTRGPIMQAIDQFWAVKADLTWFKSH